MRTCLVDHPLVAHKLTALRDAGTDAPTFRRLADELVMLLGFEATRDLAVTTVRVRTPLVECDGVRLTDPVPLLVPVLRAGLGLLEPMTRLLPEAEVGFLGMVRNEETLTPTTYADRLPADLAGRRVLLLDPMLATGGTLVAAIGLLRERGAGAVTVICLLAAPEGLAALAAAVGDADVTVVTAAIDDRLDENGYILPGLGDAGDRLFGTV